MCVCLSVPDGKSWYRGPANLEVAGSKPASRRKVWTRLKSGLFGWKQNKSVRGPPKTSHGRNKTTNGQTKFENFEENNISQHSGKSTFALESGGQRLGTKKNDRENSVYKQPNPSQLLCLCFVFIIVKVFF